MRSATRTDRRISLVVDSSVTVAATRAGGWRFPEDLSFVAPPLLWSEVTSVLHAAVWRGDLTAAEAAAARGVLAGMQLERAEPPGFRDEAWRIADELGLAKTYDAEFLALARLRETKLLTADARLYRTARRLGLVIGPTELAADD